MTQFKSVIDFISNLPLFESLKLEEIEIVANYVQRQELKNGEILFNQWDKAESVYFVEHGALEVLTKCGPDKYNVIATLGRGRSIGEMSLIDNFPRTATVQSKSDTALVLLTRNGFEELMVTNHELGIKIIKGLARLLARNLRKTSSRLADNMLPIG